MKQQATKLDAFPIPMFLFDIGAPATELNEALLCDLERELRVDTQTRTGVNADQSPAGLESKYQSFSALRDILGQASSQLLERKCTAEHLWGNTITQPHGFHMPHSHRIGNYMWNGVYFPMTLDGPALHSSSQPPEGSLVLLDPLEFVKSGVADEDTDRYPYWGNPICITPKAGTMVLFPVYLPHMVTPIGQHDSRTSIAFYLRFL